jgi:hypothetical protein
MDGFSAINNRMGPLLNLKITANPKPFYEISLYYNLVVITRKIMYNFYDI